MTKHCRGRVDKSTGLKLWCFRLSRVWVRVPVVTLVSLSKMLKEVSYFKTKKAPHTLQENTLKALKGWPAVGAIQIRYIIILQQLS